MLEIKFIAMMLSQAVPDMTTHNSTYLPELTKEIVKFLTNKDMIASYRSAWILSTLDNFDERRAIKNVRRLSNPEDWMSVSDYLSKQMLKTEDSVCLKLLMDVKDTQRSWRTSRPPLTSSCYRLVNDEYQPLHVLVPHLGT